jgi:hypothetical protein
MTPADWAAFAISICTLIGTFALMVKWLVKYYLSELKPNGGSSVKDQVNRLEMRIDEIYALLAKGGE